ncbi:MAG: RNA-binding domain-containing protein, partial [Thermomicrobiales bacterium]
LPEVSFAALKALFDSQDFDRTRPYVPASADPVKAARIDGNTENQAFHESLSTKRTGVSHVLRDIVAFANGEGGLVIVGASAAEKRPVHGVDDAEQGVLELRREALAQITPAVPFEIETIVSDGKPVLMVSVPAGGDKPYALAPGAILVRHGGESLTASRDEIVAMVTGVSRPATLPVASVERAPEPSREKRAVPSKPVATAAPVQPEPQTEVAALPSVDLSESTEAEPLARVAKTGRSRVRRAKQPAVLAPAVEEATRPASVQMPAVIEPFPIVEEPAELDPIAPSTGVEVVASYDRGGRTFYTLRDLKANTYALHVPRDCERKIWRAAIIQFEEQKINEDKVTWQGDYGLLRSYRTRGSERRYHLVHRDDSGLRVFYGVSEIGMAGPWRAFVVNGGNGV